jgi:hypothetical protein
MKKNPIMRTRMGDVTPSMNLDIVRQGSISYPRIEEVATPNTSGSSRKFTSKGEPSGRMEVKGRGAMLRATTFSVR